MRTRRLPRLVAVLVLAGAVIVATAAPAWAHAILESSDPAGGSTVARAPSQITLTFNENVEVSLGAIRLFNCAGQRVTVGAPRHAPTSDHVVMVSVPSINNGTYVVTWRVISADSHPVHGAFTFSVGAASSSSATGCATHNSGGGSKTVGVLFGATRTALFAALALLIGGAAFFLLIARGTSAARRTLTLAWIGWGVLLGATVLGAMLQGPYAEGSGIGDAFSWTVFDDILHTRYGRTAEIRLVLLAAAAVVLVLLAGTSARRRVPVWLWVSAAAVGIALAATPGWAGHAGSGANVEWAVPLDTVHVAAMSVWFGGLVALLVAAVGGGFSGGLRRALGTFSRVAFWCVVALFATGLFAAWRQVGFTFKGFTDTSYGNILLVKIGLVLLLVALAAVSRSIVRARRAAPLDAPDSAIAAIDDRTVRGLRRSVGGEVILGVAVLAVTAVLVNAQPARSVLAPALFATEIKGGQGDSAMLIDVTIKPARTGANEVHVYTLTPQGENLTIRNISATMLLPSKGIDQIPLNLRRGGANHFLTNDLEIPIAGKWTLVIHVLRGEFGDTAVTTKVPIR